MAKSYDVNSRTSSLDPQSEAKLLLIEAEYLKLAAERARIIAQGAGTNDLAVCRDLSPFGR